MNDFEAIQQELAGLSDAEAHTRALCDPAVARTRAAMLLAIGGRGRRSRTQRTLDTLIPLGLAAAVLIYLSWAIEASAALLR
jgi:hypothetical protein